MRIVVTGATGNVGTSVLQALGRDPAVHEIVGLARREPRWSAPRTRSGTTIAETMPTSRMIRSCSGSCAAACQSSSGISGISSGSPVRITFGEPTGESGSSG